MAGVGISLGIAIVYWSVARCSSNSEPEPVAGANRAWSPDAIFSLAVCTFWRACGRRRPEVAAPEVISSK